MCWEGCGVSEKGNNTQNSLLTQLDICLMFKVFLVPGFKWQEEECGVLFLVV